VLAGAEPRGSEATSLYAKLFINGFSKPSYIVVTVELSGRADAAALRAALREVLARHPLLCARAEFAASIPMRFVHHAPERWLDEGGLEVRDAAPPDAIPALQRRALAEPMDLERDGPLRVWLLHVGSGEEARSVVVVKVHHAVVDAYSGRLAVLEAAAAYRRHAASVVAPVAGAPRGARPSDQSPFKRLAGDPGGALARAFRWLRTARLRARVPEASVVAHVAPRGPIEAHPVAYGERILAAGALGRVVAGASALGLTFPQAVCAAALRAMDTYNARESPRLGAATPPRVGLQVAASRRFRNAAERSASFAVDTVLVEAERALLAPERGHDLARRVRQALLAPGAGHNELLLAAFYAARRARAAARRLGLAPPWDPQPARAIHLLYSDGTSVATRLPQRLELSPGLAVTSLSYLASPVALDQGMLISFAYAGELRLSLVYHEGAIDGDALLSDLARELDVIAAEAGE
jgi:hypothetical protein